MTRSFDGKRALVVGGTSGIGFAIAAQLAGSGAEVIVVGRNGVENALSRLPDTVRGESVDVRDEQAVTALLERLRELDHIAFTAGDPPSEAALDGLDLDGVRERLEVRLLGVLAVVKHARHRFREGGSIVLTTGSLAARPAAGWSTSSAVCGAVEGLTRALAVELAPLRVNAVAPGLVRSELWRDIPADEREEMYESFAATVPAGRVGEVDDIAASYLHLMANRFATGTILAVDGGSVLV